MDPMRLIHNPVPTDLVYADQVVNTGGQVVNPNPQIVDPRSPSMIQTTTVVPVDAGKW